MSASNDATDQVGTWNCWENVSRSNQDASAARARVAIQLRRLDPTLRTRRRRRASDQGRRAAALEECWRLLRPGHVVRRTPGGRCLRRAAREIRLRTDGRPAREPPREHGSTRHRTAFAGGRSRDQHSSGARLRPVSGSDRPTPAKRGVRLRQCNVQDNDRVRQRVSATAAAEAVPQNTGSAARRPPYNPDSP